MSIRTKLLLFIVAIVTVLNSVAFFLFKGTQFVEDRYNEIVERLLLFNQISEEINSNLRSLNVYIINQNEQSRLAVLAEQKQLTNLENNLNQVPDRPDNYVQLKNYRNMIQTFLSQENKIILAVELHNLATYTNEFDNLETTANYVQGTTQSIIDLELSYDRSYYFDTFNKNQKLRLVGVLIFIISTILAILIAIALSNGITTPIQRLAKAAMRLSKGDLDGDDIQVLSKDEVGVLSSVFNRMQRNIQHLVERIREQAEMDRHIKDLELKALQSQINPHFLFNSLNSIAKLAYLEGAKKSSDLIVTISSLLRYNLRKMDRPVTLRDELNNVNEYLKIQKTRFRDRFEYQVEIDDQALDELVPCLILQPIIENAFVHGIEDKEEGAELHLRIEYSRNGIDISVRDNGKGMTRDVKQRLQEALLGDENVSIASTKKSTGIGMTNVGKRLSLFFNNQHEVQVESEIGQGSTIRIWIPIKKEANYDQVVNC